MPGAVEVLAVLLDPNADQAAQNLGQAIGGGLVTLLFIAILVSLVFYLPGLIAAGRHAEPAIWILLLNLLLGWTCIGWIVALIWAIAAPVRARAGTYPPALIPYQPPLVASEGPPPRAPLDSSDRVIQPPPPPAP